MDKFMKWMTKSFAPRMNKIARNPWLASIQDSILTCMPLILIGSFVVMLTILGNFISWFPDFSPLNDFSMGLLSLMLSFLIPYNVMEKKKNRKTMKEAGIAGVALFLILCGPIIENGNITYIFWNWGSGGMLAALTAGLFVAFIMNLFAKFSFFKKDTQIPDFITIWFDTLIPMILILLVGWLTVFELKINMFEVITWVFSPILAIGESYIGFLFIYFLGYCFFYTFGISTWLLYGIESTIVFSGLANNQAAITAGKEATNIVVYGAGSFTTIGGGGCTLALGLMFFFMAKSQKNKLIGRATIAPSIFNINEPLIFGAPVAFNPILMVPMWIVGFLTSTITYLAFYLNLVPKITVEFAFWYLPSPIGAFVKCGVAGLILLAVNFFISWIVYLPFFRIYDKQCLQDENAKKDATAATMATVS